MISGLGISEVIVILMLVLMFFGSKELPHFIRESARFIAKLRKYSEKVRRELNEVTQLTNISDVVMEESVSKKKENLRTQCIQKRKALTDEERLDKSAQIMKRVLASEEFSKANTIMVYAATKTEVQTEAAIQEMLSMGKRVVLPYCKPGSSEMGIGEIKDPAKDLVVGEYKLREPRAELHDNFLKSDLQLIIVPGLGFDRQGGRLGRGKGYYDIFLKELKERIPMFGVAFACQMLEDQLPFDYHDVPLDSIFTENDRLTIAQRNSHRRPA